jgi:DNA mismatch endonuclease (patch repair protein)
MDRLTRERRSWNMAQIRSRDTKPERIVRSVLQRMGYRFRLNRKDLPGTPDIVLPRHNLIIEVYGCYWHRHARCKDASTPKTRTDFWKRKFSENVKRDRKVRRQLKKLGWRVIVVWECSTRDPESLALRLDRVLAKG